MSHDHKYKLVICIDKEGERGVLLEEGTISDIDAITIMFENVQGLRAHYDEKVELFKHKYKNNIDFFENKYNKKETGDITIIDPEKVGKISIPREGIIYRKDIEMFELVIKDDEFLKFLDKAAPSKYLKIIEYKETKRITDEISWIIRDFPEIYTEYATRYNKTPLKTIYRHYLKKQQLINKLLEDQQENEDQAIPSEAYEIDFENSRRQYQKYYFGCTEEQKGHQKKKLRESSGGK